MKYTSNKELECFEREDKLGKKICINNIEAQRIVTLHELGNTVPEIRNKITFHSKKVTQSTIESFLKNVKRGDIVVPTDDIIPVHEDLSIEERIKRLEDDLEEIKQRLISNEQGQSISDKLRGILNYG